MRSWPIALVVFVTACSGEDLVTDPPDGGDVADSGRDGGPAFIRDGGAPRDSGVGIDAGERDGGPSRDGGPPRDGGTTVRRCDLALSPIFGGGTSTTTLDGRLVVFVEDLLDGTPVVDADVVIETATNALQDRTDGVGCIDFADPTLTGPVTISVFSDRHVYRTLVGLERDRVTLRLDRQGRAPPRRPGRVAGIVDGWQVLTASTAQRARIGIVRPIHTDVFRDDVPQRPGGPLAANIAVVGGPAMANFIGYDVQVDAAFTTGLVVFGGTLDSAQSITHVGVSTGLDIRDDELQMGRRMTITTPMDQTLTIRRGASTGFIERTMYGVVFMPGGDLFELDRVDGFRGDGIRVAAPALTGPLTGATYGAVHVEWQSSMDEGAFSIVVAHGTTSTTVDVGDMPLAPVMVQSGRSLETTMSEEVGDYVRADFAGQWELVLIDPAFPLTIRIPSVPLGYVDRLLLGAQINVTGLNVVGVDLQDLGAADPYVDDAPTRPDFARGIRKWVQRTTFWLP